MPTAKGQADNHDAAPIDPHSNSSQSTSSPTKEGSEGESPGMPGAQTHDAPPDHDDGPQNAQASNPAQQRHARMLRETGRTAALLRAIWYASERNDVLRMQNGMQNNNVLPDTRLERFRGINLSLSFDLEVLADEYVGLQMAQIRRSRGLLARMAENRRAAQTVLARRQARNERRKRQRQEGVREGDEASL